LDSFCKNLLLGPLVIIEPLVRTLMKRIMAFGELKAPKSYTARQMRQLPRDKMASIAEPKVLEGGNYLRASSPLSAAAM
jgi:hypothetical protein